MHNHSVFHSILALGLATFVGLWSPIVIAKNRSDLPPLSPTLEQFREYCHFHRLAAQRNKKTSRIGKPEIGKVRFVPTGAVEAGQNRFAFIRFLKALNEMVEKAKFNKDKSRAEGYIGLFDEGRRSLYPEERKTTGIYYRGKVYILDGHHRALISTYFNMETMPMEIKADWSEKEPDEFIEDMAAHGYTYFKNSDGEIEEPRDLCDLLDDPYLVLARELLRRVDIEVKKIKPKKKEKKKGIKIRYVVKILDSRGSKFPIALKINRDIPFIEFEIADRLRRAGVKWEPGDEITLEMLEKFLQILKERSDSEHFSQVLLLDYPTSVEELDDELLKQMLESHFEDVQCEGQLTPGDAD